MANSDLFILGDGIRRQSPLLGVVIGPLVIVWAIYVGRTGERDLSWRGLGRLYEKPDRVTRWILRWAHTIVTVTLVVVAAFFTVESAVRLVRGL